MLLADPETVFQQAIEDHVQAVQQLREQQEILESLAMRMVKAIRTGGRVLVRKWRQRGGLPASCRRVRMQISPGAPRLGIHCPDHGQFRAHRDWKRLWVRRDFPPAGTSVVCFGGCCGRHFNIGE